MYLAFLDVVFVCVENDVYKDDVCVFISGGGVMSENVASCL